MKTKRVAKRMPGAKQPGAGLPLPPLPRWRWWVYAVMAVAIGWIIFVKIGGVFPKPFTSIAAWRASDGLAPLAISAVFTGLIVALLKIFLDLVLLGMAQRKSKRLIAEELGTLVAQVAVGVAAEGLFAAAAGAGSSRDSASNGANSGGGGDFGGGGASGKF